MDPTFRERGERQGNGRGGRVKGGAGAAWAIRRSGGQRAVHASRRSMVPRRGEAGWAGGARIKLAWVARTVVPRISYAASLARTGHCGTAREPRACGTWVWSPCTSVTPFAATTCGSSPGRGNALTRRRGHSYSPALFANRPVSVPQRRSFTRDSSAQPSHRCASATSGSRSVAPKDCAPATGVAAMADGLRARAGDDTHRDAADRGPDACRRAAAEGHCHRRCARLAACPRTRRRNRRGGKDRGAVG